MLLAAWRSETLAPPALSILSDDTREFVTSQLVRLELLPKPRFERRPMEVRFYENHFAETVACEPLSEALGREAEALAARYGLSGADALHVAAAIRQGAGEFYTSERPGKPVFRVKELRVISLHALPPSVGNP
ncbi:MAG: PIN domain-containing protein [Verrucomicrobiales bacterium]|nr:PIN domain-containing protein [Verrucomicrobiales bacterium]